MQNQRKKIYIFGAGTLGRRAVLLFTSYQIQVEAVFDNNKSLWGTEIGGVPVLPPVNLTDLEKDSFYLLVCCKIAKEILQQVEVLGVEKSAVNLCNTNTLITKFLLENQIHKKPSIFFDLAGGIVLGGVESWSIQTAKQLKRQGFDCYFQIPEKTANDIPYDEACIIEMPTDIFSREYFDKAKLFFAGKLPCVIVSNFISNNFIVACYMKSLYVDAVKHVCVIHNDEEVYYDNYLQMEAYIDKCLVISKRIYNKLRQLGFPKEKIEFLTWEIPVKGTLNRRYSNDGDTLQMGYAGRVVITQKRMDRMLEIVKQLVEKHVNFCMNIAGTGDYLETLKTEVKRQQLEQYVIFWGCIPREKMSEFWSQQDVMISCSDWEGHSITQCEAMAEGAVPVLSDVSGVRDDVIDGENGFVVPVGDIGAAVDKICFLDKHRKVLPILGKNACETIKEKYNYKKVLELWTRILI